MESDLTQEQLAEKIGVTVKIVKDYENDRRNPKTDRWPVIASATNRAVGWFFSETDSTDSIPAPVTAASTEQRLLAMLERQQELLSEQLELAEKQRQDISNLTDAIKVQQQAFLQEREFQQKLSTKRDETIDELRAKVESLEAQLRTPSRGRQQLLDAPVRPGRTGAS